MIGEMKYPATWTMDELANTCTKNENLSFARLTTLGAMPPDGNLANFVKTGVVARLKHLAIIAKGATPSAPATLLFSANIYVTGVLTDVDVYRLK
jgi:hypothetical protein